ncbi:hypothetical protein DUNSADRAFT_1106 [Dunaliella salina]|uniref:Tyrosine-protein kinase ephrin type A/B receptor-like domain-containing protein n=1 Tax=Dunaliella salina TaxID=3046 RepID=A0ABQ7GXK1_DUNSA|nr:hypothetical protein DUNSADRAFT_1106 [Dunaliella salina]|eukprot:KAF5839329.1 hypothetical protein DUNSADRAFT_1106 [Dunaliella salina]
MLTNGPANHTWLEEVGELALNVLTPASWHKDTDVTDFLMVDAAQYSHYFQGIMGRPPSHIAAGASASGYVLQKALEASFTSCDISPTDGDAHALLFGDENGNPLIDCQDGQNSGKQRVIDTLTNKFFDAFFGKIVFSPIRQNFGGHMLTLQVRQKTEDLQPFLGPAIALPRSKALLDFVMPMPNRYPEICMPGSYVNEFDPGRYAPCIICRPGDFMDRVDWTYCDSCLMNHWVNISGAAECYPCPENTETLSVGADSIDKCHCMPGFYTQAGVTGTPCLPCPEHATCAGGVDPPRNLPGWHAEAHKPFYMYDCNPGRHCTGNYTCATGYQGRLCQECSDGYFRAFNNCLECISPAGNVVAMLCMYGLFIYIVVGVSRNMETIHLLFHLQQQGYTDSFHAGQTLSIVGLFNLQWPLILEYIFNVAGILSFEMDIIQPQCATDNWSYAKNLYIQLSYPAFLFILQGLWVGTIYLAFRAKMKMNGKSLSDFSPDNLSGSLQSFASRSSLSGRQSSNGLASHGGSGNFAALETSGWWLFLQTLIHVPATPQEMHEFALEKLSTAFMSINLGYVVILKYCLQAFSCFDFEGTKYLYFSPDELCYTPEHFQTMTAAAAGLIVWIAGNWFMFIFVLWVLKRTNSFCKKRPLLLFGWMYERYESKCYWFELAILAEKTILVVVAVFIPADPILQVIIMLIVSLASTLLSIKTSAPVDSASSLLLTATDGGTMVIMVLGLMFYNSAILDRTYTVATVIGSIALIGLLVILTAAFLVEVAFRITLTILMARHKNIASKWGQDNRNHVHMYRAFKPLFTLKWLTKADPDDWLQWHNMCKLLQSSVHPTCETSYLSQEKVGHFWHYLINSFPEMLDFLASVDEEDRNEFVDVIEVMFVHYFDTASNYKCQLNNVVSERFRAAIGQWLSSASNSEVVFIRSVITKAFAKAQGKEAEQEISRAFSRSAKSRGGKSRRASSEDGDLEKKKLLGNGNVSRSLSLGGTNRSLAGTSGSLAGASGSLAGTSGSLGGTTGFLKGTSEDLGGTVGFLRGKSEDLGNANGSSPCDHLQEEKATMHGNGVNAAAHVPLGESVTVLPRISPSRRPPRVAFSDSGGKIQTGTPFAAVQGTPAMLGTENGWNGSSPVGNSSGLAARNPSAPRAFSVHVASDTDELLRVQNMHSPPVGDQPLPQPPRLKANVPPDVGSSVPAGTEALGDTEAPADVEAPADTETGINKDLQTSEGASPLGEGKLFEKRPISPNQGVAGTQAVAATGQDLPTGLMPFEEDSPAPCDNIVHTP